MQTGNSFGTALRHHSHSFSIKRVVFELMDQLPLTHINSSASTLIPSYLVSHTTLPPSHSYAICSVFYYMNL